MSLKKIKLYDVTTSISGVKVVLSNLQSACGGVVQWLAISPMGKAGIGTRRHLGDEKSRALEAVYTVRMNQAIR